MKLLADLVRKSEKKEGEQLVLKLNPTLWPLVIALAQAGRGIFLPVSGLQPDLRLSEALAKFKESRKHQHKEEQAACARERLDRVPRKREWPSHPPQPWIGSNPQVPKARREKSGC